MYAAQPDGVLWVAVGEAAGKSWWRNLVAHPEVEVLQDGRWTAARAEPVRACLIRGSGRPWRSTSPGGRAPGCTRAT